MNIATIGLWHLGTVTSLCLADIGHNIYAFDEDEELIKNFNSNIPSIYEPNIKNLLFKNLNKKIYFSSDLTKLKSYKIIYFNYDAKIENNDKSNFEYLFEKLKKVLKVINKKTLVVITSQIPIGSIKKIENFEKKFIKKKIEFAYMPENFRLGKSVQIFKKPDRIVFGIRNARTKKIFLNIYKKIKCEKIFVSPETAEMSKHVINSFLACSISFINEIGNISKNYQIPFEDLVKSVKSDKRIGLRSYLTPGNAFSGGTLGRDLNFLMMESKKLKLNNVLIKSILKSNLNHSKWINNYVENNFSKKKKILQIGLSYTDNTSTIRRSLPFQIFKSLKKNYHIRFCDNEFLTKSKEIVEYNKFELNNLNKEKFDLIVIFTDNFNFSSVKKNLKKNTIIIDANNSKRIKHIFKKYKYISTENA